MQTVNLTGISAGPANETGQSIAITAASGNPSLIPNPSVNYVSPNPAGTLTFTPVTGAIGQSTITVIAQVYLTSSPKVMGKYVNAKGTMLLISGIAALVILLNFALLLQVLGWVNL